MNIWIEFIFYLIYRFFRFLFHLVQTKIVWYFNGANDQLAKLTSSFEIEWALSSKTCQLLTIVYRKKLVEGDLTSPNDFVWWHDEFVDPKDLLVSDPCWTLYTLDKQFAYFVRMPNPIFHYHAREAPFILMVQFTDGTKLARMPLKSFCQFAEEKLNEPKGPVVYYSNAARSGSTLLVKVMQVSTERIICLGEPDVFTSLGMMHQRKFITDGLTTDLVKASVKFFCKHQLPNQTYVLKPTSNGGRMVPFIKKAMPQVKHIYTFRRNTRRMMSSLEKILRGATAGDVVITLWNINPELACRLISFSSYIYEMCQRFGPVKDCLDHSILSHVESFYNYYVNRHVFDIPVIYYEDLVSEKETTLRKLFDLCQLPYHELIGEAMQEFDKDSQAGTIVSQDKMKTVQDTVFDETRVKRMNDVCDQLQIPRLTI